MKITICGSIAVYDKMLEIEKQLLLLGHEVKLPPSEIEDENEKLFLFQNIIREERVKQIIIAGSGQKRAKQCTGILIRWNGATRY
jgi:hypothetical protein